MAETIETSNGKRYRRRRLEFILQAQEPIKHLEGSIGNHGVLMRKKVRQPDGTFETVPYVTGNAMRNRMRQAAAYALLDAAGLLGDALSESAIRLLFSGGMVTGKGDASTVSLTAYREMVDIIPTMAIFGGCAGNRVIPGRLKVDEATLMAWESVEGLSPWMMRWMEDRNTKLATAREHVENHQSVRMDALLDPGKRNLLTAGERAKVEGRLLASEKASAAADHREADATKSTMMPYTFERICEGALFRWGVEADCYNDLDEDTFMVAVGAFLSNARVGGGAGTGHGLLKAVACGDFKLRAPSDDVDVVDTTAALGHRAGRLFREHVRERKDALRKFLAEVES